MFGLSFFSLLLLKKINKSGFKLFDLINFSHFCIVVIGCAVATTATCAYCNQSIFVFKLMASTSDIYADNFDLMKIGEKEEENKLESTWEN